MTEFLYISVLSSRQETLLGLIQNNGIQGKQIQYAMKVVLAAVIVFVILGTSGPVSVDTPVQKAPDFKLPNYTGRAVQLSRFKGKIVVLEWFHCDCTFIKAHYNDNVQTMMDLCQKYSGHGVVWMSINSTHTETLAGNKSWAIRNNLQYVLLDAGGRVGKAYGARTTPHMFIIDKDGNFAYQGAIDNAPLGFLRSGQYINYVDRVLWQMTTDRVVSMKRTVPYGCRIKYAETPAK